MSERLSEEIAEIDEFIMELGEPGERLLEQIWDSGCEIAVDPDNRGFAAYYDFVENKYYTREGLSLAERFNHRVHEGLHAVQNCFSPQAKEGLINLVTGQWDKPVISPDDLIVARRLMEINAHSVQAYFNALAAKKTGDKSFITCLREGYGLKSFVELQERLFDEGKSAEEIRDAVAASFMKLETAGAAFEDYDSVTWGDNTDQFAIAPFLKLMRVMDLTLDSTKFISLSEQEKTGILNAVMEIEGSEKLLQDHGKVDSLHKYNDYLMGIVRMGIK